MTGDQLKEIRKSRGLTQKGLAEEFGVSETTVSKWEQDVNPIPKAVVRLLSETNSLPLSISDMEAVYAFARENRIDFAEAVVRLVQQGLDSDEV